MEGTNYMAQIRKLNLIDLLPSNTMLDEKAFDRELEDEVNLVADKAKELAEILGRKVTAEELAREGEVTLEQINNAVRMTGGMIGDLEEAGK